MKSQGVTFCGLLLSLFLWSACGGLDENYSKGAIGEKRASSEFLLHVPGSDDKFFVLNTNGYGSAMGYNTGSLQVYSASSSETLNEPELSVEVPNFGSSLTANDRFVFITFDGYGKNHAQVLVFPYTLEADGQVRLGESQKFDLERSSEDKIAFQSFNQENTDPAADDEPSHSFEKEPFPHFNSNEDKNNRDYQQAQDNLDARLNEKQRKLRGPKLVTPLTKKEEELQELYDSEPRYSTVNNNFFVTSCRGGELFVMDLRGGELKAPMHVRSYGSSVKRSAIVITENNFLLMFPGDLTTSAKGDLYDQEDSYTETDGPSSILKGWDLARYGVNPYKLIVFNLNEELSFKSLTEGLEKSETFWLAFNLKGTKAKDQKKYYRTRFSKAKKASGTESFYLSQMSEEEKRKSIEF